MPKRSAEEKLRRYKKKIRKLKEKDESRRKKRRFFDSSDDENNTPEIINVDPLNGTEPEAGPSNEPDDEGITAQDVTVSPPLLDPDQGVLEPPPPEGSSDTTLDPDLLSALGASTSDTPDFGDNIHENLAKLWSPLLKKGLQKEDKDKLAKEYLVPGNCTLLQAPKLNAEISAAISDVVRGRDKKFVGFQQQLGSGVSAINRAMDFLLTSDNKIQALKNLSDGCRILVDLHYSLTKDRIKLITPSLEKNFLHMIQDSQRDDTLFGNSLSDKIKASKAIDRQGSQIRKTASKASSGTYAPPGSIATRPTHQGNWSGTPRYPTNKGGRGGYGQRGQRGAAPPARRPYVPSTASQQKNFNQTKTRAPPQH